MKAGFLVVQSKQISWSQIFGTPATTLRLIPDALVKVGLCMVCLIGTLLSNNVGPFSETYVLETLIYQVEQCWTIVLLCIQKLSQNLWLEIKEHEREKVLRSKSCLVGRNVSCNILYSFLEGDFDTVRLFHAFFDQLVWHAIGTQRSPVSVPVKLGCLLIHDEIWHCQYLSCLHTWVLIESLLDHSGISTSANGYYNSDRCSSRWADWSLEYIVEAIKKSWVCCRENNKVNLLWVMLLSVWCAVVGGIFCTTPS